MLGKKAPEKALLRMLLAPTARMAVLQLSTISSSIIECHDYKKIRIVLQQAAKATSISATIKQQVVQAVCEASLHLCTYSKFQNTVLD